MVAQFVATHKAVALILTAALAGGGTLAGVMVAQHYASTALATAFVPLPSGPPTPLPAPSPQAESPAPTPMPTPALLNTPQFVAVAAPAPAIRIVIQIPHLNDEQLDQLLAPVALYPDPLISEVLPASTYPDELAAAGGWLQLDPYPSNHAIDMQPWEASVKALAHSPSVLIWMTNNPDWTSTLGTAFTYQPQDVMESIQRLRALAVASGALIDSTQQIVVVQRTIICIEPVAVDVIYVPVYDWRVVYTRGYVRERNPFTFFVGGNVGVWFANDFNWDQRSIIVGAQWDRGWDHRWDHDRSARPTNVTVSNPIVTNRTTISNNQTTVNNNTATPSARVVQVGGTAWKRNNAKTAPMLPASVTPARQELRPVAIPGSGGAAQDQNADPTAVRPIPTIPDRQGGPAERGRENVPVVPLPTAQPIVPQAGPRGAPGRSADRPPTPMPADARGADRRGGPPDRGNSGERGATTSPDRGRGNSADRGGD